jgi:GTP-binding protein
MIKIALVGRPNVGKSTLFNRLVSSNKAIVNNLPGVTRDRKYGNASLVDLNFILIDTAGIDETLSGKTDTEIRLQTELAIDDSDLIIFVIDARVGVLPVEKSFAKNLIKLNKKVIVLLNKSEGSSGLIGLSESGSLGFRSVIPFSAEHGEGLSDLYDELRNNLNDNHLNYTNQKDYKDKEEKDSPVRVGFIGRPNTGKSTLVNKIIGQNRLVTGSEAGVTRDAIEILWSHKNKSICFIDTAGLRKKSKIVKPLELEMVSDTLKTVKYSNVCVLLIDASNGLDKQDLTIARMIAGEGRGLIIAANMWDKVDNKGLAKDKIYYQLEISLSQIKKIPVVFLSGLHGQGVENLLDMILDVQQKLNLRISTGKLNRWLTPIIENNPPPLYKGKRNNIRYITQVNVRPPTFAIFMSSPENLPDSYKRYLMSSLMEDFGLSGLPIRLMARKGKNPYSDN